MEEFNLKGSYSLDHTDEDRNRMKTPKDRRNTTNNGQKNTLKERV